MCRVVFNLYLTPIFLLPSYPGHELKTTGLAIRDSRLAPFPYIVYCFNLCPVVFVALLLKYTRCREG